MKKVINRKYQPIIISGVFSLIILLSLTAPRYLSFRKLTQKLDPKTLTYQTTSEYGNIKFEYPENFPVSTDKLIKENNQGIALKVLDLKDINPIHWQQSIKDSADGYYKDLVGGKSPRKSIFSLWNLKISDEIKKTKSGKIFRVSSTFAAGTLCYIGFTTTLEIPTDNRIIIIKVIGNTNKIRSSLSRTAFLKKYKGYENRCFTEGGMEKFWESLTSGHSTPQANEWFSAANQVSESLEF